MVIRRRSLILGAAATFALSPHARAQHSAVPVIGFLNSGAPAEYAERLKSYLKDSNWLRGMPCR